MPTEVFLSHSSDDRAFTNTLADELVRQSVPVWYSKSNIRGAQQWHDEIGAALNRCDWFVIVLSPASVASMWVKRELLFTLEQERYQNKIVPILYQQCEFENLSWALSQIQMVDFERNIDKGYEALFGIWNLTSKPL